MFRMCARGACNGEKVLVMWNALSRHACSQTTRRGDISVYQTTTLGWENNAEYLLRLNTLTRIAYSVGMYATYRSIIFLAESVSQVCLV